MNKKITLASPISQREWILPYYLDHIHKINYPKHLISIYRVINNSSDKSEIILKEFQKQYKHEYSSIKIDYYYANKNLPQDERKNSIRLEYTYHHLSNLRNKLLDYVASFPPTSPYHSDYLFSVDSDILVKPDILQRLLNSEKDIISSLIYNGYEFSPSEPHKYPNILNYSPDGKLEHISNFHVRNSLKLTESKVVPVDVTGAIYLISNRIFRNKKIRYGYNIQGEDVYFCREVKKQGFDIFCDLSVFSFHIMNQNLLNNYLENVGDIVLVN